MFNYKREVEKIAKSQDRSAVECVSVILIGQVAASGKSRWMAALEVSASTTTVHVRISD
jgi:hypothetical protein